MADYHYDFPFDIMDVANILGIRVKRNSGRSVYTDCPFCGDKRGKFNLNLVKNVYKCNYCQEGGGTLELYAKLHGISNHDAYREICELLQIDGKNSDYKPIPKKIQRRNLPSNSELASLYDRNQTYEMMLSMLTLSNIHKEKLLKRGLSEEFIYKAEYRSVPAFGYDKLTQNLIEKGCVIEGVPGFYQKKDGNWSVNFKAICSGILIPIRSMSGCIQAFQIRLDKPFVDEKGKETKYIWFSSVDKEKGVSSGSPVHFIGEPEAKTVFVTEGALKSDIAHALSGRTFLAVAGAGNISSLRKPFEILKQNGTENVYETYDMDKYTNEHIKKAANALINLICEYKFNPKIINWDKNYKGVDDFLWSVKQKNGEWHR